MPFVTPTVFERDSHRANFRRLSSANDKGMETRSLLKFNAYPLSRHGSSKSGANSLKTCPMACIS